MNNRSQKGFTLVEIMIVVVIIGLLAAMAIPAFQKDRADHMAREKQQTSQVVVGGSAEANDRNVRFTYERQNDVRFNGGCWRTILVTDKVTGKQFLMIEDFGTADLNVVKIEASSRFGR